MGQTDQRRPSSGRSDRMTTVTKKRGKERSSAKSEQHSAKRRGERSYRSEQRDDLSGVSSEDRPLSQLHRTQGNQAVQRLVKEELRPKLQPKLNVGPSNDRYEREADQVAERIVREPGSKVAPGSDGRSEVRVQRMCSRCQRRFRRGEALDCIDCERKLQRKASVSNSRTDRPRLQRAGVARVRTAGEGCEHCHKGALHRIASGPRPDGVSPLVSEVLQSSGQSLDPSTRGFMEERFGRDFSRVRVHTGPKAAESAQAVNAVAYTVGQDVVFGNGEYDPHSTAGLMLIAHELVHTIQQTPGIGSKDALTAGSSSDRLRDGSDLSANERPPPSPESDTSAWPVVQGSHVSARNETVSSTGGQYLQRQGVTEALGDFLSDPTVQSFGSIGVRLASDWLSDPRNRQFAKDIEASVREAPEHVGEFFEDEVWQMIKEHWPQILVVTLSILAAETIIGVLTGAPEPTLVTKVIAVILQAIVIAVLGYFASVEVTGAYRAGENWLSAARRANGDPATITEASRAFVRMLWHIVMAVLVVAGVRARLRGATVPRGGAPARGGTPGSAAAPEGAGGAKVLPFRPAGTGSSAPAPRTPRASAFDGSAARKLAPDQQPILELVPAPQTPPAPIPRTPPAPAPVAGRPPAPTAGPSPGVQPGAASAAGLSSAGPRQAPKSSRCSNELVERLNQEMHEHCDKRRSCSMQADDCQSATEKVSAGQACVRLRKELQQKCFRPGDPGYHEHMMQIAQASAALRNCIEVMMEKCVREPERERRRQLGTGR